VGRGVGVQVDLLVLDGLPDALHEDVVTPAHSNMQLSNK
jgi:hypothetical protein